MQNSLVSFFNSGLIFGDTVAYFDHDNLLCQMKERKKALFYSSVLFMLSILREKKCNKCSDVLKINSFIFCMIDLLHHSDQPVRLGLGCVTAH